MRKIGVQRDGKAERRRQLIVPRKAYTIHILDIHAKNRAGDRHASRTIRSEMRLVPSRIHAGAQPVNHDSAWNDG